MKEIHVIQQLSFEKKRSNRLKRMGQELSSAEPASSRNLKRSDGTTADPVTVFHITVLCWRSPGDFYQKHSHTVTES